MSFSIPCSHLNYCITLSCHISSGYSWLLQTFLVFLWPWHFWGVLIMYFVGCPSIIWCFPHKWGMGRRSCRVENCFHHLISKVDTITMGYHYWCWPWWPHWCTLFGRFVYIKFLSLSSSLPYCPLWKKGIMHSSHLKVGSYTSYP